MSLQRDPDLIAAEYVLGSLESGERETVEARAGKDVAFAATIKVWENRLGPLNELIAPQTPPDDIWAKIAAKLEDTKQIRHKRDRVFIDVVNELSQSYGEDVARKLMRDLKRWKSAAIAAGAVAAVLAVYIVGSSAWSQQTIGVTSATAAQQKIQSKTAD